jgi:hypothetical protein
VVQIFHRKTDEISITLRLVHDGSFDKILPKQVGYYGQELTENKL